MISEMDFIALRWIHGQVDGDIQRALDILYFEKAKPAIDVLQRKLKKNPSATKFHFESSGFIRLS